MLRTKYILLIFITALVFTSCIKSYSPQITTLDAYKLVISGIVTDRYGIQTVSVKMASSVNKPLDIPVTGCTVTISDDQGHQFPMADSSNGNYKGWIDPQYFTPGRSFKVEILTPDGSQIVSDFDRLNSCPVIDSIYYIRRDLPTGDPAELIKGIQFYIDLNGNSTDSKYYRFEATETWEYHSEYPKEWYFDGRIKHIYPLDYSLSICWCTFLVKDIFVLSTENLSTTKYKLFPLNFVNNRTNRLVYGYSLLINQYSLSDAAYKYWSQLRTNSTNQGDLYEKQPLAAEGNLHNLTHPEQGILGYFGVSSVTSKRISVRNIENLPMENPSICALSPLTNYQFQLYDIDPGYYPIYLKADSAKQPIAVMDKGCVDCRAFSGTLVKPAFWPY